VPHCQRRPLSLRGLVIEFVDVLSETVLSLVIDLPYDVTSGST